jgi:Glycosyl hydrolase family 12
VVIGGVAEQDGRNRAKVKAVKSMGRKIWRTIVTPKLGLVAAVLLTFALGAYLSGALLKPSANASHNGSGTAPAVHRGVKTRARSSAPTKRALGSKRSHASKHGPKAKPTPTPKIGPTPPQPSPTPTSPRHPPSTGPAPSSPPTSSSPAPTPITSVVAGSVSCKYGPDTWSGDASRVGYTVQETQASDGDRSSFAVVLNADKGNTEVVGYPSVQCLTYSGLPKTLTASFDTAPPADSSGLDYEYAFDIWLTTASAASSNNWDNDLELMIWTYVHGQEPLGSVKATLNDGSKAWVSGDNTTGTVSVVLPRNEATGSVDIASIISQLKALGYITSADTGILDVEYGIEAPYGGGQTFRVNGFSVTAG